MKVEEALEFANSLVHAKTGKYLTSLQEAIFEWAWEDKTYNEMAGQSTSPWKMGYLREEGAKLWDLLSEVLEEEVTKKKFQQALERRRRLQLQAIPPSPEREQCGRVIAQNQTQHIHNPQPKWVGRSSDIAQLQQWKESNYKILMLVGEGGIGKTTLAEKLLSICKFEKRLDIKIALETHNLESAEKIVQYWLQRDFQEDVPRDFNLSLKLLAEKLRDLNVVIFIDHLETALQNGLFLAAHRDYVELLRVISDSRNKGFTLITSREQLKEPEIRNIKTHVLACLTLEDWQQYFCQPQQQKDLEALQKMHKLYDGNAYAMELLHDEIQKHYDGSIDCFWQNNSQDLQQLESFNVLINKQLNRLGAHSTEAYRLLCRLAACRYQKPEWLPDACVRALLWDVPQKEQWRVARQLCDCSLLQFQKGEYRMHPAIRAVAINQLRKSSEEWQQTNRAIAEYWLNSVEQILSSEQGFQRVEAYYHFLEIEDYDSAWNVLRCPAIHGSPEELLLYFLSWGYVREALELAKALVNRVSSAQEPSLYRCLGGCHIFLLEDGVETAKKFYLQAQVAARREGDAWTEFNSYGDIALCHYVAAEYELGLAAYQKKLELVQSQTSPALLVRQNGCYCELALLHSFLGQVPETENALAAIAEYLPDPSKSAHPWQACWNLNMAGLAQKNIGQYAQACKTLARAIAIAQNFNFRPDRARSQYILGDVYREMKDFEQSKLHQQEAIEYFAKIGAKYELAESHYYLGLTYRDLGELKTAQEHWQEAMKIFHQMKTPKQVNKVLACLD